MKKTTRKQKDGRKCVWAEPGCRSPEMSRFRHLFPNREIRGGRMLVLEPVGSDGLATMSNLASCVLRADASAISFPVFSQRCHRQDVMRNCAVKGQSVSYERHVKMISFPGRCYPPHSYILRIRCAPIHRLDWCSLFLACPSQTPY